ncbi:hypothetical protein EDB86DRAFT_2830733 [Lactarius hatsudake]|nr:hypothetical protein EDB86DRAFT_2830733 [Lactarius hatsudake]
MPDLIAASIFLSEVIDMDMVKIPKTLSAYTTTRDRLFTTDSLVLFARVIALDPLDHSPWIHLIARVIALITHLITSRNRPSAQDDIAHLPQKYSFRSDARSHGTQRVCAENKQEVASLLYTSKRILIHSLQLDFLNFPTLDSRHAARECESNWLQHQIDYLHAQSYGELCTQTPASHLSDGQRSVRSASRRLTQAPTGPMATVTTQPQASRTIERRSSKSI